MSGWHNTELFALPPLVRSEYYFRILANWQDEFRCCCVLTVLTAATFVYCSDVVLRDESGPPAIWYIANNEVVVIALLRFLALARDGAVGVTSIDSQISDNGRGVLVPLPSSTRCKVHDIGFLENIRGSGFDLVTSLFAYSRSSKVDWVSVKPNQRLYLCQFPLRQIYSVADR